ncbi:MAG TPA: YccF domain-containing protein [Candidatus Acetothermia bacterium]|nr:YccF domain-containing protein [Candidatus Acetothermia bacterium]
MAFVGNLLWFVLGGGLLSGLAWLLLGLILALTIVGIPFATAAFRISRFAFFPFGKQLVSAELVGESSASGAWLGNVLWVLLAGFWLALSHAIYGLVCFATIAGIPFGLAHFKLAQVSFAPLGKRIVSSDLAVAARVHNAKEELGKRLDRPIAVEDRRPVDTRAIPSHHVEVSQKPEVIAEIEEEQVDQWDRTEKLTPSEGESDSGSPAHGVAKAPVVENHREGIRQSNTVTVINWVPTLISYGVWFALLLVLRSVVLSMKGVERLGFAVPRFTSELYPLGLLWTQLIDGAVLTVLIFSVLALGGRLRRSISFAFAQLSRLGNIGHLAAVASAVVIGYSAYAPLIMPPLLSQGVEWAYRLIFWVIIGGIGATAVYELVRVVLEAPKNAPVPQGTTEVTRSEKRRDT